MSLRLTDGNDEGNIWDRRPDESDKAFEGFEIFRSMGNGRSLAAVAATLSKSRALIWRWSARHEWQKRASAYSRHEARVVNNAILAGTADMRKRQIKASIALQEAAERRCLSLTSVEINALHPVDCAALLRVGSEVERRAREFADDELGFGCDDAPTFVIQVISPGKDSEGQPMVGVQLEVDGIQRFGYIPRGRIDDFRRDHPDGVVLI